MTMRKSILYIFLLLFIVVSCKKEDKPLFDKTPQERESETLTALGKQLNSGNGWVAYIFTKLNDQGYSFYMKFSDNSRVQMLSDIDETTTTVLDESGYKLKWLQQPSLLFDTYGYIHRLADPSSDAGNVGGEDGFGLISDYEFGLTAPTIDSLNNFPDKLTQLITIGRSNELHVTFYKASPEEANFWQQGKMKGYISNVRSYLSNLNITGIEPSSGKLIQIGFGDKHVSFTWLDGDSVVVKNTGFAYGVNSVVLEDSIEFNGKYFSSFIWKDNKLYAQFPDQTVLVKDLGEPVIPLYLMIQSGAITDVSIPQGNTFPGWSPDFINRHAQVVNRLATTGGARFSLRSIDFTFLSSSDLIVTVNTAQEPNVFAGEFSYTYTISDDGKFKFKYESAGGYSTYYDAHALDPLFAERIDIDTFTVEYYNDPMYGLLGKFTSVEHPDFIFTVSLQ